MKIVFLEPLGLQVSTIESACQHLKAMGNEVVIYADRRPELNIERATDADIVVESNMPLRKDFFDACRNLKMLSIAFTGLDHIDLAECQKRNISVMNAAGYSTEAVSELAISMMINLYRQMRANDLITRSCKGPSLVPGREIGGKTIGIVGMGAIGQRTAKLVQAFGCKVIAWNRTPKTIEGVRFVEKETLFKEADIVVLHLALNDQTRNFVTKAELSLMKKEAILINVARGPIVNTADLAEALNKGTMAGAGLDVYDGEPPLAADNPLLTAPNTILMPHIGFATIEAFEQRLQIVVDNVERFIGKRF